MPRRLPRRPLLRIALPGAAVVLGALSLAAFAAPNAGASDAALIAALPAEEALSVLVYNVKGLPLHGRGDELARIAARLRAMRGGGRQPHVVLLQEAFTAEAKAIGAAAGYAHVIAGPSASLGREAWLDSGLVLLSDYPVLAVRRAAFPDHACAGIDCLANKGVLMALVQPPGAAPVAVIDTHLNARSASAAPLPRAFAAYRAQLAALGRFVDEAVPEGVPAIVAGDLNIGRSPPRRRAVRAMVADWLGTAPVGMGSVLGHCFASAACRVTQRADALAAHGRNKDMQFAIPGAEAVAEPVRVSVPFGRERDGSMLSDHVGYTVHYRLRPRAPDALAAARP